MESYFQKRLSRKCSPANEKHDDLLNMDLSFKMLVENTPRLRHFTFEPFGSAIKDWDLGALCLISRWQNLETLHMTNVPCEDGRFLIEIGKRCKNLRKLSLKNDFSKQHVCDAVALSEMLQYCRNLRDFTMWYSVDQADMFAALAKNVNLEKIDTINDGTKHSAAPWISSFENMIRQCEKLTTIFCDVTFKTEGDVVEAVCAVERIRRECRRPDFQMKVTFWVDMLRDAKAVVGTASRDVPQNEPFPVMNVLYI